MIGIVSIVVAVVLVLYFLVGIRIIRPQYRGVVETLGKFTSVREPGFNWIIPIFQQITYINITERMSDIEPQIVITRDNLNCKVDLVVSFRVKKLASEVIKSIYEVNDLESQLEITSRTTARDIIGTLPFKDVNSNRNELNRRLREILVTETSNWGVEVLKVELKDIVAPSDVQETMNKVIKASNEKEAAIDTATALETQADGVRRAAIKEAEGHKAAKILEAEGLAKSKVLVAEGEALRIKLVNESAEKYFIGNAQKLRQLDVTQASLENNSKIILTEKGINPTLLIGEMPIVPKKSEK